jgi:hypothetical protein
VGLTSILKRALGAVGEFDRKVVYGPDYKQRGEALAELNELTLRGKLLENQGKFERLQELKREAETNAFKQATTLGAAQDPTPIPGMVSPANPDANIEDIDPQNILHRPGEGVQEPPLPSSITSAIRSEDHPALQSAIRAARGTRRTSERQRDELFESKLATDRALAEQRESAADKNDRWVAGGSGGGRAKARFSNNAVRNGPDGKPIYGREIVFDDGTVTFVPSQDGAMPLYGASPNSGEANDLKGMAGSYQDLDKVIADWSKADAAGLLGPFKGNAAQFSSKYLGGVGLSEEQRVLMQSIDRAKTLAAFAEGGKQLTGVEKEYFDTNYPRLSNTNDPKTFIRLARELQAALRRGLANRLQVMPINRRPSQESLESMFPPSAQGNVIEFDAQGNPVKR